MSDESTHPSCERGEDGRLRVSSKLQPTETGLARVGHAPDQGGDEEDFKPGDSVEMSALKIRMAALEQVLIDKGVMTAEELREAIQKRAEKK